MSKRKEQLLQETYEAFINACFGDGDIADIEDHISPQLMGYGTAADEEVHGFDGFRWLISRQDAQMGSSTITIEREEKYRHISSGGNSAVIIEEINFIVDDGSSTESFVGRFTWLFEYIHDKWVILHFHSSVADTNIPEGQAWPIDELKRKNIELQKLVNEKTTELQLQNRELEIEAAQERIRARAMGMHHSDELSEVLGVMFEQFDVLGIHPVYCCLDLFDLPNNTFIHRITGRKGHRLMVEQVISLDAMDVWKESVEMWKHGKPESCQLLHYPKEKMSRVWETFSELYGSLPEPAQFKPEDFPDGMFSCAGYHKHGYIGFFHSRETTEKENTIVVRFAKEFDRLYQRFLDLQKAEAQAREARIEAALERVRAKAMSMQGSDDLGGAIAVVFRELDKLDIPTLRCGIAIIHADTQMIEVWIATKTESGHEVTVPGLLPVEGNRPLERVMKAWQDGVQTLEYELEGEQLEHYYATIATGLPLPEREAYHRKQVVSAFFFAEGGLYTYTQESLSREASDVFQRFTNVFALTYRRYLDLKQAEAQAREARIETALERIRARALAMRTSQELEEVAFELRHQMGLLGQEELEVCAVHLYEKSDEYFESWYAIRLPEADGEIIQGVARFPKSGAKIIDEAIQLYASDENDHILVNEGERAAEWFELMKVHAPEAYKLFIPLFETTSPQELRAFWSFSDFSGGSLGMVTYTPPEEDARDLLRRVATVFGLAYRRFLDLKKAEEQAREAQIEAALERVRARTMGMHRSEELIDVVTQLFESLDHLGFDTTVCNVSLVDKETRTTDVWTAHRVDEGVSTYRVQIPDIDHPFYNGLIDIFLSKRPFAVHPLSGDQKKSWGDVLMKEVDYSNAPAAVRKANEKIPDSNEPIVLSVATMKYGMFVASRTDPISDEEADILQRFASVFEQTYTRFLDLQKAEAQAREARIEAALERVRSRTMAMHRSEEIAVVLGKIFEELTLLDVVLNRILIWIFNPEEKYIDWWSANAEVKSTPESFRVQYNQQPVFLKYLEAWEKKTPLLRYTISGETKDSWEEFLFSDTELSKLPREVQQGMRAEGTIFTTSAISDYGLLMSGSLEPLSVENTDILQRFGQVFQQSYTRFLDLQKAEAQAREAEIELALERVRARSMAMQKSEELKEVIQLVYQQLVHLKINVEHAGFIVDYSPKGDWHFWIADQREIPSKITHPYFDSVWAHQFNEAKDKGIDLFTTNLNFEEKNKFYSDLFKFIPDVPQESLDYYFNCPGLAATTVLMDNVGLYIENFSRKPYSDDENATLMRFGKVFQQAYTRFLDLQKAEAQAREAQIEAALERVRSRTMGMQRGDELADTAMLLFEQLVSLGFQPRACGFLIMDEEAQSMEDWSANLDEHGGGSLITGTLAFDQHPILVQVVDTWRKGKPYFVGGIEDPETLKSYYEDVTSRESTTEKIKEKVLAMAASEWTNSFNFEYGMMYVLTPEPITEQDIQIMMRFAGVFKGTYRRFLDLQKAEALAREAQIEVALERVRSRTMGMQRSDELQDAAMLLFQQVTSLGVPAFACGFNIWDDDRKAATAWMAGEDRLQSPFKTSSSEDIFLRIHQAVERGESLFVEEQGGTELKTHYAYMNTIPVFKEIAGKMAGAGQSFPTFQIVHCAFFPKGYLMFITFEPVPESHDIFKRFAKVFEQTYTRFLDLQKAETQAREAQIEASLERVRAKAMAMHNSTDLSDATAIVFTELERLGIVTLRCGIIIIHETKHMDVWTATATSEQQDARVIGRLDMTIHPLLKGVFKAWKERQPSFSYELAGKDMQQYYKALEDAPNYPIPEQLKSSSRQFCSTFNFREGALFAFAENALTEEKIQIFQRFASVFALTYRRYLDLRQAEEQARDAVKQAALDRIRGEIASMRTADDLNRITPIIWRELETLEVPFIRCGVFIVDEENEKVQAYLSAPDGKSLGLLKLPFDANEMTANTVDHWKQNQVYKDHWSKDEFISWTNSMIEIGQVQKAETYQGAATPPESLDLHFVPFTQGMLYVGDVNPLADEKLDLVKTLAEAFSIAYARYEDFTKLEKAKQDIESTLSELKSTQAQLIQSEKMASLGELTAGIAHEIKNPLNFVNNFSEVSHELLEEMKEELANGNYDDARELVENVIGNLEKILHHGQRADGIVRGMLQHSRGSSSEKELTDINLLADEYLRLAYHGLRARDKSFNAEFKTDFDDTLPKINIVSQDIGRVLLNLINNAFYAVSERSALTAQHSTINDQPTTDTTSYQPLVNISSKYSNGMAVISVSDNGYGIPPHLLDKIFQPFFTTKPTGEGTGLGLSLAYDIVTKGHGGDLRVETVSGEGATFIVEIPINKA